ncbi:DUF4124 domain-containing protein [Moraxellaceae bacterium AER2_44_116]|nr:DUF4124 domain-containing protein [Moraxellaceae bacterium]TQC98124.1 DUF4124 domain-containing protein [Moraxellaceae bacterium AER2_44_116]
MRFLVALLVMLSVFSAHAEIYTCEEAGRKVFSQLPCGKDAKTVTLQNGVKKIALDMENNPNAPEEFCNVVTGGWDMAVASGHVGKTKDTVTIGRIEAYMRERIANMSELRQKGANPDAMLQRLAQLMYRVSKAEPTPSSSSLNEFRQSCNAEITTRLERLRYFKQQINALKNM